MIASDDKRPPLVRGGRSCAKRGPGAGPLLLWRLRADVPEALVAARVGVIPAEPRRGRGAGPGRGRRCADEAERRAGCNGAARIPPVPTGTAGPDRAAAIARSIDIDVSVQIAIDVAIDIPADGAIGGPVHSPRRPVHTSGPVHSAGPVHAAVMHAAAVHAAAMAAAMVAHAAPAAASAANLGDPVIIQVGGMIGPTDNLNGFSLRRAETEKREREQRILEYARRIHGASSRLAPAPRAGRDCVPPAFGGQNGLGRLLRSSGFRPPPVGSEQSARPGHFAIFRDRDAFS